MPATTKTIHTLPQIVALILGTCACGAPSRSESPAHPAASDAARAPAPAGGAGPTAPRPEPWTDAFQKSSALLAGQVRIEGPVGLVSHLATVSNPEELVRKEKTVPEGFLVTISVKPEMQGAQIKAQLDRLSIVAVERLTILERPGPVDVVVIASGDVYWANPDTGEEKRGATLRLDGKIAR